MTATNTQSSKPSARQRTQAKHQQRRMAMLSKAEAPLQALRWMKDFLIFNCGAWSVKNPDATVRDLVEHLELVLKQCRRIVAHSGEDARISDHAYIPEPLASELAEWDQADDECTFSDRESDFEDLLASVESLAENVGDAVKVYELKGWQPK